MKIHCKSRDIVVEMPDMAQSAVPLMRLSAHHCPKQRVEVLLNDAGSLLVQLGDLDWTHDSLARLNMDHSHDIDIGWDANGSFIQHVKKLT